MGARKTVYSSLIHVKNLATGGHDPMARNVDTRLVPHSPGLNILSR